MIELHRRKSILTLDKDEPHADFIRHRGKLYAKDESGVWQEFEGAAPEGAIVVDVDAGTV